MFLVAYSIHALKKFLFLLVYVKSYDVRTDGDFSII